MGESYNGNYVEQYQKRMEELVKQSQYTVDKIIANSSTASTLDKIKAQSNLNSNKSGGSSVYIKKPSTSSGNFFQKASPYMQLAGSALDTVNSWIPEKSTAEGAKGNVYTTANNIYGKISDAALSSGNPYAMAAGVAMKAGSALNKGLSSITNGATSNDGMCVCAGTKVFTSTGKVVNIENLQQEAGIIGWNETTKAIYPQNIDVIIEPRQKECVEITLKSGIVLRCSTDHPILSDNSPKAKYRTINNKRIAIRLWKFRRADELKVGDFVGLANNIDYWGSLSIDKAYLIGMLIGDGSYTKGTSCRIISADPETWDYIESNNLGVINHCDDSRPEKYNTEIRTYRIVNGIELMKSVGLAYQYGKSKTLPKNLGDWDKQSVCKLIAGLFDTDGSISVNTEKKQYSITLYQSNRPLLEEVKIQLHKLGIFSTINTRKPAQYQLGGRIINSNESYRLEVRDINSVKIFYKSIHLNIKRKQDHLDSIYQMIYTKNSRENNQLSGAKQSKIVSIVPIGIQTVYNLQTSNDHTYLANGIITHNTTVDSILASDFLWADPISLIANLAGKKSHKLYTNDDTWASAGASYAGSKSNYDEASTKANKKYSAFSTSARHKANDQIDEANQQLFKLTDIMDKARDQFDIRTAMSYLNSLRYGNLIRGGYQQDTSTAIGKNGMKIKSLKNNIKLVRQGSKVPKKKASKVTYSEWVQGIPKDFINPNYDLEGAFNAFPIEELERWRYAINHLDLPSDNPASINYKDKEGNTPNHLHSLVELPNGDYMFLKKFTETLNPEVFYETRSYYDGSNGLKETHDLIFDGDRYYYRKKTIPKHESGGSIQKPINGSIISIIDPTTIEDIEEFKDGGSINVIPDGALHARLHHMEDADNLTKKGIPVVDNNGEQQAEVEKEEIILRLDLTKKLEELEKKYYNEETSKKEKEELALEAGKLLSDEILNNTQDNTKQLL